VAHFAKVEDGVVTDVIVVDDADCGGGVFPASEAAGRLFIAGLAINDSRLKGEWLQTSYNTHGGVHYPDGVQYEARDGVMVFSRGVPSGFRSNFAQIGFTYDPDLDAFLPPKD
jgi:hypothetical protein